VLPTALGSPILRLPLRASRHAAFALCAAHALAAAAMLTGGMPPPLAAAGVLALGFHALIQIRRHAGHRGPGDVTAVEVRGPTHVRLLGGDGAGAEWEIVGAPLVSPLAVLITLRRPDGERRSLWLPGDACPAEGHRRLRVLLQWRALVEPRSGGAA